jgi:hypothetical protein
MSLMNNYIDILSQDPGFGFIGILKTSTRKIMTLSPLLLERAPQISQAQCIEETLEMMDDVRFLLTVGSSAPC